VRQSSANDPPQTSKVPTVAQRIWRIARPLAIAYLLICLLMTLMETHLVYPVPPAAPPLNLPENADLEEVWFNSADGTKLHGLFANHPDSQRALLYFHGNAEDVCRRLDFVRHLRQTLDASVFVFTYRGYGHSEGSPHEQGIVADGLAAQRWLTERMNISPDEVTLMGRSLGGAVAVAVAAQRGACGLVLISTFADMTEVAADIYPWLPVGLLMRNRYPADEWIQQYTGPVLQFHGTRDRIIPLKHGKKLFDAAPGQQKEFIELPKGRHNDPLSAMQFQEMNVFLNLHNR